MSESQSRYSIVERLTQSKLDVMTEIQNLVHDVTYREQSVEALKRGKENYSKDAVDEVTRVLRVKDIEIQNAETAANNAKEQKESKTQSLNKKIEAINDALKRIEEISKTAPTN